MDSVRQFLVVWLSSPERRSIGRLFRDEDIRLIGMVEPGKWLHAGTMEDVGVEEAREWIERVYGPVEWLVAPHPVGAARTLGP